MKIDFFACKKFYAVHIIALLGFLTLLRALFLFCIEPLFVIYLFLQYHVIAAFYCIPLILFIIDFAVKRRVKNDFFLNNAIYGRFLI